MRDHIAGHRRGEAGGKDLQESYGQARQEGTFASHGTLQQIQARTLGKPLWGEIEISGTRAGFLTSPVHRDRELGKSQIDSPIQQPDNFSLQPAIL
jgi:hypothetical protein